MSPFTAGCVYSCSTPPPKRKCLCEAGQAGKEDWNYRKAKSTESSLSVCCQLLVPRNDVPVNSPQHTRGRRVGDGLGLWSGRRSRPWTLVLEPGFPGARGGPAVAALLDGASASPAPSLVASPFLADTRNLASYTRTLWWFYFGIGVYHEALLN